MNGLSVLILPRRPVAHTRGIRNLGLYSCIWVELLHRSAPVSSEFSCQRGRNTTKARTLRLNDDLASETILHKISREETEHISLIPNLEGLAHPCGYFHKSLMEAVIRRLFLNRQTPNDDSEHFSSLSVSFPNKTIPRFVVLVNSWLYLGDHVRTCLE